MKIISLGAAALAGASGFALLAGEAQAQPASSGQYDWSGPYVDLNLGWNHQQDHASPGTATTNQVTGASNGAGPVSVPPASFGTAPMSYSTDSLAAGGGLGFNHQVGALVLGVEGDMDRVGGDAHQLSAYGLSATGVTSGNTVSIDRFADPDWTASLRGRLGFASGRVLVYGTGGVAWEQVRQGAVYGYDPTATAAAAAANPTGTFGPFSSVSSADRTLTGWTLGAGAEMALNRRVSIGAEYRYSDYGRPDYPLGANAANSTFESTRLGLDNSQLLAKLNFHF